MARLLASLLFLTALAGCNALSGGSECPTSEERKDAEDAFERFEQEDFGARAMTVVFDGRMDGENADATLAVSPGQKALRISSDEGEYRIKGNEYSIDEPSSDGLAGYGRNHKPSAMYDEVLEGINDDSEDDTEFLDDLVFTDFEIACAELGDVLVLELTYEDDETEAKVVLERGGQNRFISATSRDEISDDNFRMSFNYDDPTILVDQSLPRLPLTAVFESTSAYENLRGGLIETLQVHEDSEWAPLSQMVVQLTDGENVYFEDVLRDGFYDWEDGDTLTFDDRDDNGLLSKGDRMVSDLGPGLFVAIWDDWADQAADVQTL